MVAGTAKALEISLDYVLHDLSYANLLLYNHSLPTYRKPEKEDTTGKPDTDVVRAEDPNYNEVLRKMIDES